MPVARFGQSRRAARFGPLGVGSVELLQLTESLAVSDAIEAELGTIDGTDARQLVIARVALDAATENLASLPVRHPARYYDGRVLAYGNVDRSVPLPPELPETSSAQLRIADPDQLWRGLLAPKTARRRRIETRVGVEGESELTFQTVYAGEIQRASFPPGEVSLEYLDTFFAWMNEPIPNLISPANFDNLPDGTQTAFFPIVFGRNWSVGFGAAGAFAPPYVDTVNFLYALNRNAPIAAINAVYRKAAGDADFSVVDPLEYHIHYEVLIIDGVDYSCSFLQFDADQLGAEIRCDIDGGYDIAAFGTLPFGRDLGLARNAVDFAIGMLYLSQLKHKLPGGYDYASFARAWGVCDDIELYCDGIIDEPMTMGEFFGRFSASTMISIYQNRQGKIALAIPGDEDDDPPELDDVKYLYRETVQQQTVTRTLNRIRASYGRLFGWAGNARHDSQWGAQATFNNDADQIALGGDGAPIVEEDTRELWFVRDAATAEWVALQYLRYFGLDCLLITAVVPLPPNISRLELTREVALSHYGGAAVGGFVRERCQIQALSHNLDTLETTVTAIRKSPLASVAVGDALVIADSEESATSEALVFTEDFSSAPTAHGSQDLGTRVTVTTAFPLDANVLGVNITHDGSGNCLHFDFMRGDGHGGFTMSAKMALAVPGVHALLQDSDQLSESACIADNSIGGSLTRLGPSVFQEGTWNSAVPRAYFISNLPELGKCVLKRINSTLVSEVDIGTHQTAALGDMLSISAKDNGASVRVRLFVNGVLMEEVNDSSASRIHLPSSDDTLGMMGTFCSAPRYSQWTPVRCVIPA